VAEEKPKRVRPDVLYGDTKKHETAECGNMYTTLNADEEGLYESWIRHGKQGGCEYAHKEAIGRLISIALQAGASPARIARNLRGIQCDRPTKWGKFKCTSCLDAIGQAIQKKVGVETPEKEKEADGQSDKSKP
jgi:ribonucleoside-diphosphate reductase alpha chain